MIVVNFKKANERILNNTGFRRATDARTDMHEFIGPSQLKLVKKKKKRNIMIFSGLYCRKLEGFLRNNERQTDFFTNHCLKVWPNFLP